jgi:hypothetical protein
MKTRPYAVDRHPKSQEIQQKLAEGVPIRSIAERYGIHRNSLARYKQYRLPDQVVKAAKSRDITSANELFDIILKAVRNMEKLADSCDEYLQDPDNPNLYYMGPRAHEVDVVWDQLVGETKDRKPVYKRHRESLQDVIDRHFDKDSSIVNIKTSHTDPRVLLVKSAEMLTKQMDTLVQAWKQVDQGSSSFIGTPAWQKVVQTILEATEEYPEMRRRIADELSKISE